MAGRYDRVNGVFNKVNKRFDKVNGVWQPVKKRYDKVNGMWQPSFTNGIPVSITTGFYYSSERDTPYYSVVNSSDSNNFSFYGFIKCAHAHEEYKGYAIAKIYFETPTANSCMDGANILNLNGTVTRVQSGYYSTSGSNTTVVDWLSGMKNQSARADQCTNQSWLISTPSNGATTFNVNQTMSLIRKGSDSIAGFEIEFDIYLYVRYTDQLEQETVSLSIPWSAFAYLPTGEHLVYNP